MCFLGWDFFPEVLLLLVLLGAGNPLQYEPEQGSLAVLGWLPLNQDPALVLGLHLHGLWCWEFCGERGKGGLSPQPHPWGLGRVSQAQEKCGFPGSVHKLKGEQEIIECGGVGLPGQAGQENKDPWPHLWC